MTSTAVYSPNGEHTDSLANFTGSAHAASGAVASLYPSLSPQLFINTAANNLHFFLVYLLLTYPFKMMLIC